MRAIVIGGPNGAGKTTTALELLPFHNIREFVNADEIARGISPYDPDAAALAAGRLLLQRLKDLVAAGEPFALETTCAGHGHVRFLWLPTPDIAVERVAQRVRDGGHGVDEAVVTRRYWAGLCNMRDLYLPLADSGIVWDNATPERVVIAESSAGKIVVRDAARWQQIVEAKR
jgi:predicted ABC-type ATPase